MINFDEYLFSDLVIEDRGLLRGPFGGSLKKEIFIPKSPTTYKVYEQGVVLQKIKILVDIILMKNTSMRKCTYLRLN